MQVDHQETPVNQVQTNLKVTGNMIIVRTLQVSFSKKAMAFKFAQEEDSKVDIQFRLI